MLQCKNASRPSHKYKTVKASFTLDILKMKNTDGLPAETHNVQHEEAMTSPLIIANANAKHIPLTDQSVQCIVTSPPYWGLRDYGTEKWEGGSEECDHVQPARIDAAKAVQASTLAGSKDTQGHSQEPSYRDICARCGARRIDAQIGLEPTPAAYVASIVAVMREVWRVLKDDGVLWLNLGDSYNGSSSTGGLNSISGGGKLRPNGRSQVYDKSLSRNADGLKPKDLCGIPWRVAFALQDDGWYLRQDIIWHKPNPMPESVTDRCTKAHEYVFLLTKRARYYYDAEAIAEQASSGKGGCETSFCGNGSNRLERDFSEVGTSGQRNRRSVWTVATSPYSGAHFATFPPALIEPMILAGSRRGDIVLDPFGGSGTAGRVAIKHGRRAVLLDLNTKYIDLQFERTSGIQVTLL